MKVNIFVPCFVDQLFPETAFNMVKVLEKLDCEVAYNKNQTCCGQPAFNAGFISESRSVAEKFLKDFENADYVVAPSASCVGFVRNYYSKIFHQESDINRVSKIKDKIFEFTEFLTEILKVENIGSGFYAKATYHDSCAALRECKIKAGPRKLLSNVQGLELIEMKDNETCCGFGGTFAVKFSPISVAMAEQKITNVLNSGANCIISTDISCLMHIDGVIKNQNLNIQTMHIADVLASGI